jgi:phospholipase C
MPADPGHEFGNVLDQLSGPSATYPRNGPYPPIDNSGYLHSYVGSGGGDPGNVMRCFTPDQLPVLNALAKEFVVCDNWHASLPGPTWPNRMFAHAASSGGLDHSPSTAEILKWEAVSGFPFPNGTIFDALAKTTFKRCLYAGDDFPMVSALKGIRLDDIRHYSQFAGDLGQPGYPYNYIFIEPSYDILNDYRNGTSQHPLADVTSGEALIKATYEAIRNSAVWPTSMLIVTWDEHGGLYDHAIPPAAIAPGDTSPGAQFNKAGFTFEQYGPRVPAVIISPLIPRNLVDHRVYDHSSIPRLLEKVFTLPPLTKRDAGGSQLADLITLSAARQDVPTALPAPANSGGALASATAVTAPVPDQLAVARPDDTADHGNLPAILQAAMHQDLELAGASQEQRGAILKRFNSIQTRRDAMDYLADVRGRVAERRKH